MGGRHQTWGVLFAVVIAGCSGLAGSADQRAVSVTPVDIPTDAPVTAPEDRAKPGFDSGGFEDPDRLAAAHGSILQNTSYTVESAQTIRFTATNRTGRWQLTGRFGVGGAFLVDTERTGSVFDTGNPVRIRFWSNGAIVVESFIANDSTIANVVRDARGNPVPPRTVLPIDPRFEGELAAVFASTSVRSISRLDGADHPYKRVRVDVSGPVDARRARSLEVATSISNLTARLVIDERGFVHRYQLRYTGSFAGKPVTVTRSVEYRAVGDTDVARPDWAAAALNGSTPDYVTSSGSNGSS